MGNLKVNVGDVVVAIMANEDEGNDESRRGIGAAVNAAGHANVGEVGSSAGGKKDLSFRVPPEFRKRLKRYSIETEDTMQAIMVRAVEEYMDRYPLDAA